MNTINLKALSELARQLDMHVSLLEYKLNESGITIQYSEPCGFRTNRRKHVLSLYN